MTFVTLGLNYLFVFLVFLCAKFNKKMMIKIALKTDNAIIETDTILIIKNCEEDYPYKIKTLTY